MNNKMITSFSKTVPSVPDLKLFHLVKQLFDQTFKFPDVYLNPQDPEFHRAHLSINPRILAEKLLEKKRKKEKE